MTFSGSSSGGWAGIYSSYYSAMNLTTGGFGDVILGGYNNTISEPAVASVVFSGHDNLVTSANSTAAGIRANAIHDNTFIWSDSTAGTYSTTAANEFRVRASGGIFLKGPVLVNEGTNIVYYCSGSTGGTFDGNLARGNGNAGACAGGSWVATSLKVD